MRLKMTVHFQARLGERNIDIDHVKQAIRSPDSRVNVFDGKIKVTKKIGGKEIEVIYSKEAFKDKEDEYLLVTAYYK
jgi:hypothetical protein